MGTLPYGRIPGSSHDPLVAAVIARSSISTVTSTGAPFWEHNVRKHAHHSADSSGVSPSRSCQQCKGRYFHRDLFTFSLSECPLSMYLAVGELCFGLLLLLPYRSLMLLDSSHHLAYHRWSLLFYQAIIVKDIRSWKPTPVC